MENEVKIESDLLTPKQLSDMKIMGRDLQLKLRDEGKLKYYKLGRKIFYSKLQIQECLELCEQNVHSAQA